MSVFTVSLRCMLFFNFTVHKYLQKNCFILSSPDLIPRVNHHYLLFSLFIFVILGSCNSGWIHFEQSCYFVSYEERPWLDARLFCQAKNAELIKIETVNENEFISLYTNAGSTLWAGGNDIDTGNNFV